MSYKTILVHVDQSPHAATRIKAAAQIAMEENAHLIGAAMNGLSRFVYAGNVADLAGPIISAQLDALNAQAAEALEAFESIVKGLGVLSYERRLIADEPEGGLALQGRYADLVVVSQANREDSVSRMTSDLPEYVMLNCVRPVLVIPYSGNFETIGTNVLVAWDGSMEAARALANAIPLLRRAKAVTVALFNRHSRLDTHGEQPGDDIALYLARHDVKVEVLRQLSDIGSGDALLSLAKSKGFNLLVMGGYGHTRFREVVLGGVTDTILRRMTLPVLISH